jgi:hypothetical protein
MSGSSFGAVLIFPAAVRYYHVHEDVGKKRSYNRMNQILFMSGRSGLCESYAGNMMGRIIMRFMEFRAWLSEYLGEERKFQTLKGRSFFYARYDCQQQVLVLRLRTEYRGQLRDNQIQKIFDRYGAGSQSERNMTSFYYDPWWPETPSRILAPTVPAIIKVWIDKER